MDTVLYALLRLFQYLHTAYQVRVRTPKYQKKKYKSKFR